MDMVDYGCLGLIFERFAVWCGFKNNYQKDVLLKEVGLCVQNLITILRSILNIIWEGSGDMYDQYKEHENLHLICYHMSPKNHDKSGYALDLDLLTISY